MSVRQIRKLYGGNTLPPPEGNSDEEYEPLYAKSSPSKFKYQGLVLSSHSESEHESAEALATEDASPETFSKKKKKKKKKQRKPKEIPKENIEVLDEIDKSVMEVNALLGTPEPVASVSEEPVSDPQTELMAISYKHINANYELNRLFGPEEPGPKKQRGRQAIINRLRRKALIVEPKEPLKFTKFGLSMSILRSENGYLYFIFEHSREYQRIHRAFLQLTSFRTGPALALSIEDAERNMHVEGILESADSLFRFEAYSPANSLIELAISYMQYVAHPSFNLMSKNVRLEYRYLENRPFHIALLKYLHLLTNRACHRTALELAKVLLNLDPTDPLAVVFIIDTLALRAREHQWLIDAVAHWSLERDAGFLFNIQYSHAMAHFHVARKNKADFSKADELLRDAMMRFPSVALNIMKFTGTSPPSNVKECSLFSTADETTGKNMRELMALYAKFTWSKWREPHVFEWLQRNLSELADQFAADKQMQERAKELSNERLNLFKGWPDEIIRHLCVIRPMASLLVDGEMPNVRRTRAADPVPPPDGISRYNYDAREQNPTAPYANSPLYELFSSVLPQYVLPRPRPQEADEQLALEVERLEQLEAMEMRLGRDIDSDTDTNTDDDDSQNEENEENEERNVPNLVATVNTLTQVFRQFVDAYESGATGSDGTNAGRLDETFVVGPNEDCVTGSDGNDAAGSVEGDVAGSADGDAAVSGKNDTVGSDEKGSAGSNEKGSAESNEKGSAGSNENSATGPDYSAASLYGPDTPDFDTYVVRDPVPLEDSDIDIELDEDDVNEYNMMHRPDIA